MPLSCYYPAIHHNTLAPNTTPAILPARKTAKTAKTAKLLPALQTSSIQAAPGKASHLPITQFKIPAKTAISFSCSHPSHGCGHISGHIWQSLSPTRYQPLPPIRNCRQTRQCRSPAQPHIDNWRQYLRPHFRQKRQCPQRDTTPAYHHQKPGKFSLQPHQLRITNGTDCNIGKIPATFPATIATATLLDAHPLSRAPGRSDRPPGRGHTARFTRVKNEKIRNLRQHHSYQAHLPYMPSL